MWRESSLDGSSGGCDSTPQASCELIDEMPVRSIASGSSSHNDIGVGERPTSSPLQAALQDLDCEIARLELQCELLPAQGSWTIGHRKDAGPHCGDLGTVLRTDRWRGLLPPWPDEPDAANWIGNPSLPPVVDVKVGAVGGDPGVEHGGDPRGQIPSCRCRSEQDDLWVPSRCRCCQDPCLRAVPDMRPADTSSATITRSAPKRAASSAARSQVELINSAATPPPR